MGYGAFMRVINTTDGDITLTVGDMNCMYDDGSQGSNLQVFNNVTLQPDVSVPSGGKQYIEAVASGACAFEESYFYINVSDPPGGYFRISEQNKAYAGRADPPDRMAIAITQGTQAAITVVLLS